MTLRDGDPRQVGPYTLLGRLGEGGMGVVYLAQAPDGARVAVKLIHARLGARADFRWRFAREVAAAQRVARFCTAPVLDADVVGDLAYLVTEYVEGPSLRDAVETGGPLRGSALDGLAAAMAMALRAIHGAGVVHRDLKPSNVLLSQVGPKVIDFGIAQLADAEMSSEIMGTPVYMSPEQVAGGPVGPASDIFSWGGTLAFAAGGAPPFGTGPVPTVLMRIVNDPPDLRGLSGPLRDLVAAALAKEPAGRPTAQDLMDRLSAGGTSVPGGASVPGTSAPSGPGTPSGPGPAFPKGHAPATGAAPGRTPATDGPSPEAPSSSGRRRRGLVAATAAALVAVAGVSAAVALRDDRPATGARPSETAEQAAGSPTARGSARPTGNPLRAGPGVTFYAPEEPGAARQASLWQDDRPQDAELMRRLARVPYAIRLNQPEVRAKVAGTVTAAEQAGGVPVFLLSFMPGNECHPTTAEAMPAYQKWVAGVARQIGDSPAVVILEPGSLVRVPGTEQCDGPGSPQQRYQDVRQAVRTLKANPNTAVYLDGSQDYWPGTEIMAGRLIDAGIEQADGFFVNTGGYQRTDKSVEYGKALSACIAVRLATGGKECPQDAGVDPAAMPHFVVDTSRNGRGSWAPDKHYEDPQTWCNPPGRGVGDRPTTETGEELADAYLWISRAGTSNGRCRRGTDGEQDPERGVVSPPSGEWWGELALERAKNAVPPLR
ncbi:glycoside hydrolase family 6 protein [Nonomuraea candida]|uniref:glycoside hydrolase family 6 protein n=1 Tax=Nonomuraea candida TaxID=359159 RepID=UPI000A01D66E|nr:glycoside hydrolase family 6 protein [Nonomuraea candida]